MQFVRVLRELTDKLPAPGWPPRPGTTSRGARAIRRTAPTIARALAVPVEDMYALGNWVEDPSETAGRSRLQSMPVRYTSEKGAHQLRVKSAVLKAAAGTCAALAGAGASPTDAANSGWADLVKMPALPLDSACVEAARGTGGAVASASSAMPGRVLKRRRSSSCTSSSSSSTSSSTSSSPGAAQSANSKCKWVMPVGSRILHRSLDDECTRPRCGLVAAIAARGQDVASAHRTGAAWCKRCALDLFQRYSSLD